MEGPGLREALFMLVDRCIVLSSYRVPPWLAIGRFNVLLALFGEFGPAFLAATVLVTKSCSFQPCFLYTSLNSWCCHIVNKTWPANLSTLGVYFCRCRVIFSRRSTPLASRSDLEEEAKKKVDGCSQRMTALVLTELNRQFMYCIQNEQIIPIFALCHMK